jgi:hypothetical protein
MKQILVFLLLKIEGISVSDAAYKEEAAVSTLKKHIGKLAAFFRSPQKEHFTRARNNT